MLIKYLTPLLALHLLVAASTISVSPFLICSAAWADNDGDSDEGETGSDDHDTDDNDSDDHGAEDHSSDSSGDSGSSGSGPSESSSSADDEDRERRTLDAVERAVRKKEILSLTQVKTLVHAKYSKQIVKVKIERYWFQWIYKIKAVNKKGRLIEIVINAENGKTIRIENE